jgi:DNA polymerase-3 subunit epsilon
LPAWKTRSSNPSGLTLARGPTSPGPAPPPTTGAAGLAELVATHGLQGELDRLAARHCPPERRRHHAALYDALAGALLLGALAHEPRLAALTPLQLLTLSTLDGARRDAFTQESFF